MARFCMSWLGRRSVGETLAGGQISLRQAWSSVAIFKAIPDD